MTGRHGVCHFKSQYSSSIGLLKPALVNNIPASTVLLFNTNVYQLFHHVFPLTPEPFMMSQLSL